MKSLETQVGGDHYKKMAIQPAEFSVKNQLGFCEGNIIKYVCRYQSKNGVEDLKKARHYLDMLIDSMIENKKEPVKRDGALNVPIGPITTEFSL